MTVSYKKTSPAGGRYYLDGLQDEGLHDGDNPSELAAQWWIHGPGSAMIESALGIDSGRPFAAADVPRFEALVQGFHPAQPLVKKRLVHNAGNPRRVALHDFTVSAPKSVSVVWAQSDRVTQRLIEAAQARAARAFVSLLGSRAAFSRQGKAGVIKTPCAVVAALFAHSTSRAGDPQLHTHCTLLNLTVRPDGSSGALETRKILRWQGAAACLYHVELAFGLQQLGFGIVRDGNLFKLDGVPAEVCAAFSQRRQAVLAAARSELLRRGSNPDVTQPSRSLLRKAVIDTRGPKVLRPRAELVQLWSRQGEAIGFAAGQVRQLMRDGNARVVDFAAVLAIAQRVAAVPVQELNEFTEPALVARVAVAVTGMADADSVLQALDVVTRTLRQRDRDGLIINAPIPLTDRDRNFPNSRIDEWDESSQTRPGEGSGRAPAGQGIDAAPVIAERRTARMRG